MFLKYLAVPSLRIPKQFSCIRAFPKRAFCATPWKWDRSFL